MKRTLIRCGYLVSMDDGVGDMRGAEMLIGDDRILAIGKTLDAAHDELIDASAMIAMPGLVNKHLHTFQTGLRALGSEWTPADYFTILYGGIATRFTPQDNYLGTLAGALSQLDCEAHAGNVDTVIVDGITRKSGGRLQVDAAFLSRLRTELQASASRLIGEWEDRRAK